MRPSSSSLAIALIALHVLDDNFLQPQPGTSPGDHLASGLVPLALLGLAAWAYPRLRGGRRGALALFLGPLGIAAGIEAFHYTREVGASGDDFTGLLTIPAGAAAARPRRRHAVAHAADRRQPLVALRAPRAARRRRRARRPDGRRCRSASATSPRTSARAVVPAEPPRRPVRGREVHDRRRARARGLVRAVAATAPP